MSHMVLGIPGPGGRGLVFPTSAGYVGGTSGREFGSSYIRSGSAAPSRAHSPSPLGSFVLPPLHHQQPSSHLYGSTSPHHHHHSGHSSSNGVPSISELERHYYELAEEKRRFEELLDRTDRLMSGVRRGMDELRERELALSQQQQANGNDASPPATTAIAPAVPLPRNGGPGAKENVWSVAPAESSARD